MILLNGCSDESKIERERQGVQRNTKHNSTIKFQFTFESEEKRTPQKMELAVGRAQLGRSHWGHFLKPKGIRTV